MNAIHSQDIEVPVYGKPEPTSWGGKARKQVGIRTTKATVYVDMAEIIRQLGLKAAKNKTGRARYMKGAVIVEVF